MKNNIQNIIFYLTEIRKRLLICIVFFFVLALMTSIYANQLFIWFASPLNKLLPESSTLIATQVMTPFTAPFKLALLMALFISIPFFLFQFWQFVKPALYKHEKKKMIPLLVISIVLFYAGACFAYFFILPVMFNFVINTTPEHVQISTDISAYLDFVAGVLFSFGIVFETPVFTFVLCQSEFLSYQRLVKGRRYVFLGSFVIGMLLTPPDILSQTLVSLPLYLLFEAGLQLYRITKNKKYGNNVFSG